MTASAKPENYTTLTDVTGIPVNWRIPLRLLLSVQATFITPVSPTGAS